MKNINFENMGYRPESRLKKTICGPGTRTPKFKLKVLLTQHVLVACFGAVIFNRLSKRPVIKDLRERSCTQNVRNTSYTGNMTYPFH